jgi:16S rRNA (cytosine967-C5)-methyltransferase
VTPAPTARGVALRALVEIGGGGRANVVVPRMLSAGRLDQRDRHLVTELVYGTCRMQRACDWLSGRYARGRLDPDVRAALRLGTYQLGWMRIPSHAAVSATVSEVRGPGRSVVNAVLRRVASDVDGGLVTWPDRATELSYPDWVVDGLCRDLGRQAALDALETMNQPAAATVRADGYTQDRASQMIAEHLLPCATRARVLDACAAPGGKATALATDADLVVAADISLPRTQVVQANGLRLGTRSMATLVADATDPPFRSGRFDLVLVDAPCSGLGVLRRRPDARWRIQPGDVERLSALQRRLLRAAAPLVRPGGVLAYSVCTLTALETAAVDRWAGRELADLAPVAPPGPPWRPAGRGALLLPQAEGTDGMFLLVLMAPG